MTKQADFKRRVRERMRKTGESYATARVRLLATKPGAERPRASGVLHVTNGDSAAGTLERALGRRVLPWRDALHEGPVPAVEEAELRRVRAFFLGRGRPSRVDQTERWLEARDEQLAGACDGEYLLWFEADVYDQLQLVQILSRLAALGVPAERITLVSIGEYPGIAHFGGLGELDGEQLAGLLETNAAAPLTPAALDLATRAWTAFRAPEPSGFAEVAAARSGELRFVAEAFDRLAREYPSSRDGLSLTERRILAGAAEGAATAGEAFVRVGAREARPFLGDWFFLTIVARLAGGRSRLLEAEAPVTAASRVELTEAGRAVLDGTADHVDLNGIDRWIGGVHLAGDAARWRFDEGRETITASTPG